MNICDVSVIIPNFNRTSLLRRALESVVAQTCLPSEILVVDDCSASEKVEEIRAIVGEVSREIPVKLLINDSNRGANYSRNRGIFAANARYLAFLDSDDLWMPDKLRRQLTGIEAAQRNNGTPVLSATGRYRVSGHGKIIVRQFGGTLYTPEKIRRSNFIGTLSSVIVETSVARKIGGFQESLSACQDWDFFIRLANQVQYVGVAEPLCVYVDHDEERITLDNTKRLRSHIYVYRTHLRPHVAAGDIPADFYRNIAEDYEQIGNAKRAKKFLAKANSISPSRSKHFVLLSECLYNLVYWLKSPRAIKAQRYMRYRNSMRRMLRDPEVRFQMDEHQTTIYALMSSQPENPTF